MKLKVITLTNQPQNEGFQWLKKSLDYFGYDWHCIETTWQGFGTKIIETAKYLETIKDEYTHFIFLDAHDVFALEYHAIALDKLPPIIGLISAEKACWPNPNLADKYPKIQSDWKYVNSGSYFMPISMFLQIIQEFPIQYNDDDQLWLTNVYLSHKFALHLDYTCEIFQSMAFEGDDDFNYHSEIFNRKTNSYPIFFHFNGKTQNERAYKVLENNLTSL